MNIKKILCSLFIGVSGLPVALHAGDFDPAQNEVRDWSAHVCKQKENSCAFHAVKNAKLLFDYLKESNNEAESKVSDDELKNTLGAEENSATFPLSTWQNFIKKQINLEGSELTRVAIDKANLGRDYFTVIDSFEEFMEHFKTGPMLADEAHGSLYKALLRLKSQTPSIPHIFFLGSMNHDKHNGIGHWVTCVANVSQNKGLELHYADSMDPGNISTLDPAQRLECMKNWGLENSAQLDGILGDNAQVMQTTIANRKTTFTGLLKRLIKDENPIHLLLTSPLGNNLDSVEHLNGQHKPRNALPHLKRAIHYVQDWQLLDDHNFSATDYPARLKKTMSDTLAIEITAANFRTIVEELDSLQLEELERKYNLVEPEGIVNSSQRQHSQAHLKQNSLEARLQQIKKQKNKKNWFQRLTSYIAPTPQRVLFAGFCTAACWILKKMLDNNNGGSSTPA